ncbi:MAG TPA: glycosyltransferase family 39 protein [Tepidisphaeraceae bacterium]|nr:glycosyltransferase family 39 protein [Tepidisphaeraceae bacterium]
MIQRARFETALLAAIVLFAGAYRLAMLDVPFGRDSEGCGAFFGLLARNYFRYDWSITHGIPVMSMGQGQEPFYYANHPPTTAFLIAIVDALAGYHGQYDVLPGEWTVRLPTTIFTLACVIAIYLLLKRRAAPRAGLIAAAVFASIPLTLMFGGLADVISPQLVFFAIITVTAYESFHDCPGGRKLLILSAAFFGAAVTDWPAFFLLPVLGIHFVLTRNSRQWSWFVAFGLISTVYFLGVYAYLTMGQPGWWWLVEQFSHRAIRTSGDSFRAYSFVQWLRHAVWELGIARHTLLISILGLLWLPIAAARRFSRPADSAAGLLLIWGLLHVLIGRQGVYQHEWWWWPLTPGLVIAAALLIDDVFCWMQKRIGFSAVAANIALSVGLACFAAWNTWTVLTPIGPGPFDYSLADLGKAVRDNTPPDQIAMIAESDQSLAFWYYADRGVRRQIWDLPTFQRRLDDTSVDLSFDAFRPWKAPVRVMIVPKNYLNHLVPPLLEYLNSHYFQRDSGHFVVYDLASPTTQSSQIAR